jgi:hypothetical protein
MQRKKDADRPRRYWTKRKRSQNTEGLLKKLQKSALDLNTPTKSPSIEDGMFKVSGFVFALHPRRIFKFGTPEDVRHACDTRAITGGISCDLTAYRLVDCTVSPNMRGKDHCEVRVSLPLGLAVSTVVHSGITHLYSLNTVTSLWLRDQ